MHTPPDHPFHRLAARAALAALLALAAGQALASGASLPPPRDLAIVHALSALVAGGLAFLTARQWPAAGIVVAASLADAARYLTGSTFVPEALQQGGDYLAQAQALALLVPLGALLGIAAHVARVRR